VRPFAAPAVQWILYGGLTILVVFVLPRGIVPTVQGWIASRAQSKGAGAGLVWAGSSESGDAKR
jgi:branched-chain amino acid transport system permease protein